MPLAWRPWLLPWLPNSLMLTKDKPWSISSPQSKWRTILRQQPPTPTGTPPSVAGDTPSAADSLDKRIEESVRKAVLAFEQRLSLFETQQKQQLQHNRLQEVLAQCQDSNFRMQSLRDFPLMHFATPTDFEQYLQQKKNDVQQANQTLANRSLALQHPPFYTKETPLQNVSPAVVSFIQLQANAQQQFKGKQV